jgi:hypothetical protein
MFWFGRKKKPKIVPSAAPLSRIKICITKCGESWGVFFEPTLELPRMHLWAKDALMCLTVRALLDAKHRNPALAALLPGILAAVLEAGGPSRFDNRPTVFTGELQQVKLQSAEETLIVELLSPPLRPATVALSGNMELSQAVLPLIQQLIRCLKAKELQFLFESIAAALMAFEETNRGDVGTIEERAQHHKMMLVARSNPQIARQFGINP